MQFNWEINLGHLISLTTIALAAGGIYNGLVTSSKLLQSHLDSAMELMAEKLNTLGGRVLNVENGVNELTRVATQIAVQDQRMENIEQRLNSQARRMDDLMRNIDRWRYRRDKEDDA